MTAAVQYALAVRAELRAAAANSSTSFDALDEIYNRFTVTITALSKSDKRAYYAEDARLRVVADDEERIEWPEWEPHFPGWIEEMNAVTTKVVYGALLHPTEEEIEWP